MVAEDEDEQWLNPRRECQQTIEVPAEAAGQRLDQFLASATRRSVSRSRVQLLMEQGDVLVNGEREKASMKLRGGERIAITGEPASRAAEGHGGRHSAGRGV